MMKTKKRMKTNKDGRYLSSIRAGARSLLLLLSSLQLLLSTSGTQEPVDMPECRHTRLKSTSAGLHPSSRGTLLGPGMLGMTHASTNSTGAKCDYASYGYLVKK